MTISEAITLCEDMAEADIKELTAKDRLNFWQQIKEFEVAKIQRIPYQPIQEDEIQIHISYD